MQIQVIWVAQYILVIILIDLITIKFIAMVHLYSFMIGIVNIVKIIEIVIEPIPNYDKSNLRMEVLIIIAIMKIFHSSKDNS